MYHNSGKPAAQVPIRVQYSYDSYGWFYFARIPPPVYAQADNHGTVIVPLADYRYSIIMNVNDLGVRLNKRLVRHGGTIYEPAKESRYIITLEPLPEPSKTE